MSWLWGGGVCGAVRYVRRGLAFGLEKRYWAVTDKASSRFYHAVPVSQSSHRGICSASPSSIVSINGAWEGYKGAGSQWLLLKGTAVQGGQFSFSTWDEVSSDAEYGNVVREHSYHRRLFACLTV